MVASLPVQDKPDTPILDIRQRLDEGGAQDPLADHGGDPFVAPSPLNVGAELKPGGPLRVTHTERPVSLEDRREQLRPRPGHAVLQGQRGSVRQADDKPDRT